MQQDSQQQPIPMVLELFGHQRIAGYVSEATFAGASVVRVDVPEIDGMPAFTKMFHPNAVYAFNPVDVETMMFVAEQCAVKPITVFDISEMRRKMLASLSPVSIAGEGFAVNEHENDDDENDDDENDDDEPSNFNDFINEKERW